MTPLPADLALKAFACAEVVSKLKQASDLKREVVLAPDEVVGLLWGIRLMNWGIGDAAAESS
jgi:hypothetical protein